MRKSISQLNMLSPEEYGQVVRDFNNNAVDYPRDKCVHTLFEEQVAKTPDKVAVIACDNTLTYSELNEQANRIAHNLIAKGVKPNDIIAFMLPRKSYLLSVMFGILKSGAAYMPIDPDYPQDRIDYMLNESKAVYCITEDNIEKLLTTNNTANTSINNSTDNLFCALHTSGSTGKPKMTLLTHKNLANFICWSRSYFKDVDICVTATIVTFDAFIYDTIVPISIGLPVFICSNDEIYNQSEFEKVFERFDNISFNSTPTKLKSYISNSESKKFLSHTAKIICGGEVFTADLYNAICPHTQSKIYNGYGPVETSIIVTVNELNETNTNYKSEINKSSNFISQIGVMSKAELETVTKDFNNTAVDYPRDKCVHTLFEEQVAKTPDKVAVIAQDKTLTYSELNEQANRVAHSLIAKGVNPNDIIAFMLPRKSYLLSVMFGILKSGAAYMPIDPDYPQDRIDYMLKDSDAKFCITEDNINELLANENKSNPNIKMSSDGFCYCIYTSGTTGNPKATVIKHFNIINFCSKNSFNSYQHDIQMNITNSISLFKTSFDAFGVDTLLMLLNEKTIVLCSENEMTNPKLISKLCLENKVDIIQATPSIMSILLSDNEFCVTLKQIKIVLLAAETLKRDLVEIIKYYTSANIYNGYGPSETTIGISFGKIK